MHFIRANAIDILSVGSIPWSASYCTTDSVNLSRGTTGIHTNPTCIQQSLVNLHGLHVSLE